MMKHISIAKPYWNMSSILNKQTKRRAQSHASSSLMLCFELTDSSARGWIISDSLSGKQTAESYTTLKHQVNLASERWHHIYKANAGTFRLASGASRETQWVPGACSVCARGFLWDRVKGEFRKLDIRQISLYNAVWWDTNTERYPLSGMPNTALMYNTSGRQQCAKLWDKQTEDTGRLNCCGSS